MAKAKRNSWTFNLLRVFIYALLFGGGLVGACAMLYLGEIFFNIILPMTAWFLPDFRNQSLVNQYINQIHVWGLQSEIKRI